MNATRGETPALETVVDLLLRLQESALREIELLSRNTGQHDHLSAHAALSSIYATAKKCHDTYQAVVQEIITARPDSSAFPPG